MNNSKIKLVYLLCFFLILLVPLIQLNFELFPRKGLHGLNLPSAKRPHFNQKHFVRGDFQEKFDRWFLTRHGLYGYLVRAANEVSFRFFDIISPNYKSTVLVGHEGQMFQSMYLDSFNRVKKINSEMMETRAKVISEMQHALKERGIASTLLISTNLLELYPELIPKSFHVKNRLNKKNDFELMEEHLKNFQVNTVNGHNLLDGLKGNYPFRFFEPTASHWNSVAACLVTKELVKEIENQLGKKLNPVDCEPVEIENSPHIDDTDLLEIANLLFPQAATKPTPYVKAKRGDKNSKNFKPKILIVGTSFSMTLTKRLIYYGITDEVELFFYYNRRQTNNGDIRPFTPSKLDFEEEVLKYDAIIVEANISRLSPAGFDFPKDLIRHLKK